MKSLARLVRDRRRFVARLIMAEVLARPRQGEPGPLARRKPPPPLPARRPAPPERS